MDKEAQNVPAAAILYKKANDILGFDLLDICINGLKEKLDSTVISQVLYFNAFVKVGLVSLFVSPTAKHVVVAVGNQITILSKEDDCQHPFSIFTSCSLGTFSVGAWSEDDDILGVTDDTDTLYFIKFNGEVIAEITKKHLKVSSPIVGLFSDNGLDTQKSYAQLHT